MSVLDAYRQEIRAQLDANCFLRRDQAARALFICDYPRRGANADGIRDKLLSLGYVLTDASGMWLIDLSPARYARDLGAFAPQPEAALSPKLRSLCRSLRAQGDLPISAQPLALLRCALLYADENDFCKLYAALSPAVAVLKRQHAPLPAAAANIIEAFAVKEVSPC